MYSSRNKMSILNHAAVEALCSATYVENYLDCANNLSDEVQRMITKIFELDFRTMEINKEMKVHERLFNRVSQHFDSGGSGMPGDVSAKQRLLVQIQRDLIRNQEIADEKLRLVNIICETIEGRRMQLDLDRENLDPIVLEKPIQQLPGSASVARIAAQASKAQAAAQLAYDRLKNSPGDKSTKPTERMPKAEKSKTTRPRDKSHHHHHHHHQQHQQQHQQQQQSPKNSAEEAVASVCSKSDVVPAATSNHHRSPGVVKTSPSKCAAPTGPAGGNVVTTGLVTTAREEAESTASTSQLKPSVDSEAKATTKSLSASPLAAAPSGDTSIDGGLGNTRGGSAVTGDGPEMGVSPTASPTANKASSTFKEPVGLSAVEASVKKEKDDNSSTVGQTDVVVKLEDKNDTGENTSLQERSPVMEKGKRLRRQRHLTSESEKHEIKKEEIEEPRRKKKKKRRDTKLAKSPIQMKLSDIHIEDADPDEVTYCSCNQISYGDMIGCDYSGCSIEWYHFQCVGLESKPKGKWYCPSCRRADKSNVCRSDLKATA